MSTLDNGPDDGLVVSESESTERIKAITEKTIEDLDDLKIKIFETITGPESINAKNVRAITRELFEKILKGEDLTPYSQVINFLNQKFSKIWDDFKKTKNPQNIKEFSMAFGFKDTTTLSALLQGGTLQKVLAGPEFYNGKEPYDQAVKYTFTALFPGEELLILKNNTPEENFKLWNFEGLTMDDTEALKKTLETRAKEKTTDSIKTYFGARWKVEEELEQINSTTKEYISYVKIDGTSFKRKLQDFQLESYKKTIEESLQQTYYEEQRIQLNKILKAAGKPTID